MQITFDYLNRLSAVTSGESVYTYTYNGDNLRKSKTISGNTTQYILDGMNVIAELNSQGNRTYFTGNGLEGYLSGSDRRYYRTEPNGTVYSVHGDESENYQTIGEYTYGGYGEILTDNTINNPFKFAGEYNDDETGLIYLRNRYYDSSAGRFISEDPAMDGNNWYIYCNNNPINFVDPWGLAIYLTGNKSQQRLSYEDISNLTDDIISYDKDTGMVSIVEYILGDKTTGTQLVRDLLGDNFVLEITRNAGGENPYGTEVLNASNQYVLININDNTLPNVKCLVQNSLGEIYYEEAPSFIAMGHEMIHALHYKNGTFNSERTGYRYYNNKDGESIHESVMLMSRTNDEFETIGLGYISFQSRPGNKSMYNPNANKRRWIQSTYSSITENTLRKENKLALRIAY